MYIIGLFLAIFIDLGKVCNKTAMSFTNFYRSLHCEGTQIHGGYFLISSPEKDYETWLYIFAVDVTIYQTYIDKTFAQTETCWYPSEILQLFQSCREYCLSEICKHTSKTGSLSYIKLKRFVRLLQCNSVLRMLPVTKFYIKHKKKKKKIPVFPLTRPTLFF